MTVVSVGNSDKYQAVLADSCVLLQPVCRGCVGVCCFVVLVVVYLLDTELRQNCV